MVNERVAVIARYRIEDARSLCFPAKMRWRNNEITFIALGLRHDTRKGARMVHVFDMSDGSSDYRLEFDAEALTWTLISVLGGNDHAA